MSTAGEASRDLFNLFSAQYDLVPWNQHLTAQIRTALQNRKDWIGIPDNSLGNVKLLDYACGTGAITKALGPYVGSIKGIDVSDQMVERYNEAARASGLSPEQAHAVIGNLLAEDGIRDGLVTPEYSDFDIAAVGLGFHHFDSPSLALRRLTERLRPGSGVLLIIDFLPPKENASTAGHHHEHHGASSQHHHGAHKHEAHAHSVTSTGFTEADMQRLYEEAGAGADFGYEVLDEPAVLGEGDGARQRQLFIAKGKRASAKL
ncbi:S-adenosyl-L-methionine-dependent methyltransferase [Rhizodiscina lignyota]|uniref:S-adenosyl-L-methionine-dependent methyltransferase n=1 Tax=Rhizodiscina lignyota TaxID=1504668 RepID=A0A9P4I6A2_9PEZI|nr:S-adenosyl-L-methionine-dependent methyltransferase [Rhizodiscina lignyota]